MKTCVGRWLASVLAALIFATPSFAQVPAPPSDLNAADHPWDNGTRIDLTWMLSPDDASLQGYIVREKAADAQEFRRVDMVPKGTTRFTVADLNSDMTYLFQVIAVAPDNSESAPAAT
jgi:Fibronectin type III domain